MAEDPLIGTLLGQYRIERVLGKGGMATVYQSTQVAVNRTVAIKVLPSSFMHDETFMTRFRQEAEVAAQLEHIRILPVYDYGEHDGVPYIVMRYLDGGTLRERTQEEPIPPYLCARIAQQIAEALDYAHSKQVIHRDLKPSNIMLDSDSNAYLTDFGTAKLRDRSAQLTGSGIVGTPAYMAPEQSMPGPLTPSVDIYALGVTLFEMITGNVPYSADTPIVQILMHIQHPVPSLLEYNPAIPDEVDAIIKRAMDKRPEERYATALELAYALEDAIHNTGGWVAEGEDVAGLAGRRSRLATNDSRPSTQQATPESDSGKQAYMPNVIPAAPDYDEDEEYNPVITPFEDEPPVVEGLSGVDEPEWAAEDEEYISPPKQASVPTLVTDDGQRQFELTSSNILIGRDDPRKGIFVDIELTELDVKKRSSRSHARILERNGEYVVWDLHSMNGTYVNGERLAEGARQPIQNGDAVMFGKDGVVMMFNQS